MNAVLLDERPSFAQTLRKHGITLPRTPLEILQINVGKLCDLACHHCHVEAGPKRTEIMQAARWIAFICWNAKAATTATCKPCWTRSTRRRRRG